jgi:site-specific recombinase XerD
MLRACQTERERWALHLALLTGARRAELLGFQGRHFRRHDFVHVSADIAKGSRDAGYRFFPSSRASSKRFDSSKTTITSSALSAGAIPESTAIRKTSASILRHSKRYGRLVREVGQRAGIRHPIRPHLLRHAFADYIAEAAGDVRIAQLLLGHADSGPHKRTSVSRQSSGCCSRSKACGSSYPLRSPLQTQ